VHDSIAPLFLSEGSSKGDATFLGPQLERLRSREIIGRHLPGLSARTSNCGKHDRGAVIAPGRCVRGGALGRRVANRLSLEASLPG
jgi:hypothetical protein